MEIFGWIVLGAAIGVLVGGAAVWLYQRKAGDGKSLKELQKENAEFRRQVTDHFVETATLINRMTDSYKAVFDHLSEGAGNLVDPETLKERLPPVSDREVRLRHIGAPGKGAHAGQGGTARSAGGEDRPQPRSPAKTGAVRSTLSARRPK